MFCTRMVESHNVKLILLTGATGHVGGRVCCLAQRPEDLAARLPSVLVVEHDLKRMIDCRRDNLAEILGREK